MNSAELRKHNTLEARPMVAIRGKLYDLTDFVDRHPGGRDIMLLSTGRDVTQVYETYHDMARTEKILRKYHVGTLTDSALPTFPEPSPFQTTLRTRISEHFRRTGHDPKFHPLHLIHYAVVIGAIVGSYYAQFFVPVVRDSLALSTIAALVLGLFCAQSCFTIVHDASHASFSHKPWLWTAFGAWHDFMNGASHVAWFYQHVLGHHPYTNLPNADPDVATSDKHFRRIRPHQKWFMPYLHQHLYAPIAYSFYGLKSRWDDVSNIYLTQSRGAIAINPLQPHQHAIFWAGKAFFLLHRIVLPALFCVSLRRTLWLFFWADVATSLTLALVFQANHVVEHVAWPHPDKDTNIVPVDWMEMQIETAQDYGHDHFLTTKFTGALNYQVVHHAFPNICQWWYTDIAPIVKQTCKEYNVTYHLRDTFYEAIKDHIDLLWVLGRDTQSTGCATAGVVDAASASPGYINGAMKEE
ncbi:delta-5 desaturase [Powellomyces hirtus]|nr:delta-5 desaturase [Powellomyces hirtus]